MRCLIQTTIVAAALMIGTPVAVMAQAADAGILSDRGTGQDMSTSQANDRLTAPQRRGNNSRLRSNEQAQAAAPADPAAVLAAAQAQAQAAQISCQVGEAVQLGVNAEQQPIFEATCASGPGYILIASTPPQAVDCVVLAGQAEITRSRDPAADVGLQCKIAQNTDVVRVVQQYAQEAGVRCDIDQGASVGKTPEGNLIYEVGCRGTDGFWLERAGQAWEVERCLTVVAQNGTCRFTTSTEQAASVKAVLAGSEAASCDVTQARYMGSNANGTFYEAKCAAGDGYIARVNADMAVQQVYPCADAARIGGGCKLTAVAVAPATPAAR
jgi:hypothetical protein